jgi:hypothetical protein
MLDSAAVLPVGTTCALTPETDVIRLMFKAVYNPLVGRTDTETEIARLKAQLLVLMNDTDFWSRLMNGES